MVKWFGEILCDAGFIINLKKREDRLNRAKKELKSAGFTGIKKFNAITVKDPNFIKYGCTQSHIEIAKKQLENNWDYVLYLEDDVVCDYFYSLSIPSESINKKIVSKNIIEDFKKYKPDILWLGVRPEDYTEKITDSLVKSSKTLMSHAYIGSKKYAKFLVDNLQYKNGNHFSGTYPIDFFISQISTKDDWRINHFDKERILLDNDLKVFISVPMIFNQGASFSDLTDNHVDYKIWVQGCYNEYINIDKLKIKTFLNE